MGYDRILVPLDGSRLAEFVLPHVERIVHAFHSELILVHVITGEDEDSENLTQSQIDARADIASYLERVSDALSEKNIESEWRVCYGDPAKEIARLAAEGDTDLIMMSTHGQGSGRRADMGSVAMAVVSTGSVPVLLIKPPDEVATR